MKIIDLPSGAKLEIALAPFKDAHDLQKALAKEMKEVKIAGGMDITDENLIKDVICTALSSDKIIEAVFVCMKRCTYNGLKITLDTFESEEARGDYYVACMEVAKENILPFLKGLSPLYGDMFKKSKV